MRALLIIVIIFFVEKTNAQKFTSEELLKIQQKGENASENFLIKSGWTYQKLENNTKPPSYYNPKKKTHVMIKYDSSELNHKTLWTWGSQSISNPTTLNIIKTVKNDIVVEYETNKETFLKLKNQIRDSQFVFKSNEIYYTAFSSIYLLTNIEVEFMMEHFSESTGYNPTDERFLYTKYIIRVYPTKIAKYYSGGVQKGYKTLISAGK